MRKTVISWGLCLALVAGAAGAVAQAQTVAAGARAVVSADTLPVYASMSEAADVRSTLKRGDTVIIGLVLFGSDTTWCAISKVGETRRLGYASCEFLEPDRPPGAAPAQPAPPPAPESKPSPAPVRQAAPLPPAPQPKSSPITIRQAAPAAITVREMPAPPPKVTSVPDPTPAAPAPELTPEIPPPPAPVIPDPAPAPTPPPPPAAVRETEPPAIGQSDFVEVLLDGSGLRSSLANYTQTTHLLSFLDKSRLAELELPALERILSERFQPGAFYVAIGGQMRKNYSPERLLAVTEWLRSPATVKLAGLESRAYSTEVREQLVAYAGGLSADPPAQPRLQLIHRLYDSLRTCDMEVETTIALVHTIAQAIGPVLPKEKRYTAMELDRALGAVKSRYRSVMKNARIVHYLFAYQPASDDELEGYVNFLESDNGKWLISVIDKGFYDATEAISRDLLTEVPRNVKPKRHLPGENTAKGLLP